MTYLSVPAMVVCFVYMGSTVGVPAPHKCNIRTLNRKVHCCVVPCPFASKGVKGKGIDMKSAGVTHWTLQLRKQIQAHQQWEPHRHVLKKSWDFYTSIS